MWDIFWPVHIMCYCVDGKEDNFLQCWREGKLFWLQCMQGWDWSNENWRRTEDRSSFTFFLKGWLVCVDLPSDCCLHRMVHVHNNIPTNILSSPVSNIKIYIGHTELFRDEKYLIRKWMFPQKIWTFHCWENMYWEFLCLIEIGLHDPKRN